jgi:hypothetical protein
MIRTEKARGVCHAQLDSTDMIVERDAVVEVFKRGNLSSGEDCDAGRAGSASAPMIRTDEPIGVTA